LARWKCGRWKHMGQLIPCRKCSTVKSDDVAGRDATYQAIVSNKPIEAPGTPAAFKVLVKELQSLGLAVESIMEDGEIVTYGKDSERRDTHIPTGLLDSPIGA